LYRRADCYYRDDDGTCLSLFNISCPLVDDDVCIEVSHCNNIRLDGYDACIGGCSDIEEEAYCGDYTVALGLKCKWGYNETSRTFMCSSGTVHRCADFSVTDCNKFCFHYYCLYIYINE
jgi:hypothetical protein